ncbi:MAG: YtxH domain-containing protein [Eubacterium sp.]|nr:YtxH domain-containing protein [Eubacterium sp.]
MAVSSVGSYTNSYENLYISNQVKKSETSGASKAKAETTKKSSNEEYLKNLQKQVPYIKLQTGYGINTNNDGKVNVVDVNPKLLEKMQNNPEAAKEYTQRLKDVESCAKFFNNFFDSRGSNVVCRHDYLDENGNYTNFTITVRKDELNEKFRKEAQENAEKQIGKTRENARKKSEQLAEKIEEKTAEANEKDEKIEIYESIQDENNTAKDKAEKTTTKLSYEVGENFDFKI